MSIKIFRAKQVGCLLLASAFILRDLTVDMAAVVDLHKDEGTPAVCTLDTDIYQERDIDSSKVGSVKAGTVFRISGEYGEFLQVKYGDSYAYMLEKDVLSGRETTKYVRQHPELFDKKVIVTAKTALLYSNDTKKAFASATKGTEFLISNETDYYYNVTFDGQDALLSKEDANETIYVKVADFASEESIDLEALIQNTYRIQKSLLRARNSASTSTFYRNSNITTNVDESEILDGILDKAQRMVVKYSLQFIGNPYVWGGNSLTDGTDCSGYVQLIYRHFGISIPRVAEQQASCGEDVDYDDMQPGDLLFYMRGSQIGHVSMYIGDGKIAHAKGSKYGIVVEDVSYSEPTCIKRLIYM